MNRMLALTATLVISLATAGIAQAESATAKSQMPNVSVVYGPTEYNSAPVSTATAYDPKNSSFITCAPSICGRFAVVGKGEKQELVLQVSNRDKVLYGALVYVDKAGDSHQVAHVKRNQRIPLWTDITMFGRTVKYHLISAAAYLLDPREAVSPPAPACISGCMK
jgi:hypothetical protein